MSGKKSISILLATLTLVGAGCDFSQRVDWLPKLPFGIGKSEQDSSLTTQSIVLEPGLSFMVRPSALGLSGSVDELMGDDARAMTVVVNSVESESSLKLVWSTESSSGTLALNSREDVEAMLLPAFWVEGDIEADGNGGLWLSRSAYDDLDLLGKTEWRLGLAEGVFSPVNSSFKKFNELSTRIFNSATNTEFSNPFSIKKTAVVEAYAMKVDGRIVLVRAIKVSSWFAEFLILENAKNPLILKVTVNPLAEPALKAFESAEIRWKEIGYEITSITNP